jgi:tetratricopeptide (TPR) repeat protein
MSTEKEKKQAVIKQLVEKLNQDNHQLDVILELSANLVSVGDLEQAEELLTRSLSIFPDNQDLIYNLANVYYTADKFDRASELFDQLIAGGYGFEAYFMKAKTLDQQGQRTIAIAFALTAVEKAPHDVGTNELMADLLMANGDFNTAIGYYQLAIDIKPQSKFYFNIAVCQMNLEQPYQEYLEKSKDLDEEYYLKHEQKLAEIQKFLTKNGGNDDGN